MQILYPLESHVQPQESTRTKITINDNCDDGGYNDDDDGLRRRNVTTILIVNYYAWLSI